MNKGKGTLDMNEVIDMLMINASYIGQFNLMLITLVYIQAKNALYFVCNLLVVLYFAHLNNSDTKLRLDRI